MELFEVPPWDDADAGACSYPAAQPPTHATSKKRSRNVFEEAQKLAAGVVRLDAAPASGAGNSGPRDKAKVRQSRAPAKQQPTAAAAASAQPQPRQPQEEPAPTVSSIPSAKDHVAAAAALQPAQDSHPAPTAKAADAAQADSPAQKESKKEAKAAATATPDPAAIAAHAAPLAAAPVKRRSKNKFKQQPAAGQGGASTVLPAAGAEETAAASAAAERRSSAVGAATSQPALGPIIHQGGRSSLQAEQNGSDRLNGAAGRAGKRQKASKKQQGGVQPTNGPSDAGTQLPADSTVWQGGSKPAALERMPGGGSRQGGRDHGILSGTLSGQVNGAPEILTGQGGSETLVGQGGGRSKPLEAQSGTLLGKMRAQLLGGRFRWLNERLYTSGGGDAYRLMQEQPELYEQYHEGFRQQTQAWPVQPVDTAIAWLQRQPPAWAVADFGCGDAKLAASVRQRVHSFDLVAGAPGVIACNMAHVPLKDAAVDAAVFCLALMGSDYGSFLEEAHRVLRPGGWLWIAEVRSRFAGSGGGGTGEGEPEAAEFIACLMQLGFKLKQRDVSNKMFITLELRKAAAQHKGADDAKQVAWPQLKPCVYKKR